MPPIITATYAAILGLIMAALFVHVVLRRAATGISILDGGDTALAERMRRHGNFV